MALALLIGIALSAGILKALHSGAQVQNADHSFDRLLFVPPILEGRLEDRAIAYSIDVARSEKSFLDDNVTETWSFGLDYLGPTIRLRKDQQVSIDVAKRMSQSMSVQWHGMILPAEMDGGPHQPIAPGETWRAEWMDLNEAATYWYHPHSLQRTGEQV